MIPFAEEILSQSRATWFSTDGSYLMYASFNTSQVGQVSFKIYGGDDPNNVFEDTPLYGDTMSLRYPKVSHDSTCRYLFWTISSCPYFSKAFRH